MGATVFHDFKTIDVGAGATFHTARAVDNPAGHSVIVEGSLTMGGGAPLSNEGYLEIRRSGHLEIKGAITNNDELSADGGTLTVDGDVSGIGFAMIIGGALRFRAAVTQNIFFHGGGGEVELVRSQVYAGDMFSFLSTGAANALDLDDIVFVSSSEATFSSGVLTVTDGTHTAHIGLGGAFRHTTFIASPDGHGGVLVETERTGSAVVPSTTAFTGAMAGLGAGGSGGMVHGGEARVDRSPVLCRPRAVPA